MAGELAVLLAVKSVPVVEAELDVLSANAIATVPSCTMFMESNLPLFIAHRFFAVVPHDACAKGKLVKSSFKSKDMISTSRPLELLHMDLFGPISIPSLSKKKYVYVIVDDFSRYTWTLFLQYKEEAFENCEANTIPSQEIQIHDDNEESQDEPVIGEPNHVNEEVTPPSNEDPSY